MRIGRDTLIAGAAIAALVLWARRAQARGVEVSFPEGMYDYPEESLPQQYRGYHDPVYDAPDDGPEAQTIESQFEYPGEEVPMGVDWFAGAGSVTDILNRNTDALLEAIRWAEHYPVDVVSGADFNTFYGGAKFTDMSDHPVITGELKKVRLPEGMCKAIGYTSGVCYSSAAGAFQLTVPTWTEFRSRGAYLGDFSPENQREAARRILNAIGAVRLLQAGDFAGAVQRASARWASLPGSTAKQGGKSLAFVKQKFLEAGGSLA